MTTYYAASLMDGTSFHEPRINYLNALGSHLTADQGTIRAAEHPRATLLNGTWPCRLFEVEGEPTTTGWDKHGFSTLKVTKELPSHLIFGEHGKQVAAILERITTLTPDEAQRMDDARRQAIIGHPHPDDDDPEFVPDDYVPHPGDLTRVGHLPGLGDAQQVARWAIWEAIEATMNYSASDEGTYEEFISPYREVTGHDPMNDGVRA